MDTAVINVRTSLQLKTQAQKVAEQLGFSLSAVINAYLRQLVRTKMVKVSLEETPSEALRQAIVVAERDHKLGKGKRFRSYEQAVSFLDGLNEE